MTGDLNAEPETPPIRELRQSTLGLRDAHEATQTPRDRTRRAPSTTSCMVPSESRRIDYILSSPSLGVENYAVLAWQGEGGRPASDHFPVIADVNACGK